MQLVRRHVCERVDIQPMVDPAHGGGDGAATDRKQIGAAAIERRVTEPGDLGNDLVRHFGQGRCRQHVAARNVDLRIEYKCHGITAPGLLRIAIHAENARDRCAHPGLHIGDPCTRPQRSARFAMGALFYGQPRRRTAVTFDPTLRALTQEVAAATRPLIASGPHPAHGLREATL